MSDAGPASDSEPVAALMNGNQSAHGASHDGDNDGPTGDSERPVPRRNNFLDEFLKDKATRSLWMMGESQERDPSPGPAAGLAAACAGKGFLLRNVQGCEL